MRRPPRWSSPIAARRPCASTRTGPRPSSRPNAGDIRRSPDPCGIRASCRRKPWRCWRPSAAGMVADLKYFDGSLARIDRIPAGTRELFATAFEVDPKWLVECAARRQKWIDQAQSLNIYMGGASGKQLDEVYRLAWVRGLKTT